MAAKPEIKVELSPALQARIDELKASADAVLAADDGLLKVIAEMDGRLRKLDERVHDLELMLE